MPSLVFASWCYKRTTKTAYLKLYASIRVQCCDIEDLRTSDLFPSCTAFLSKIRIVPSQKRGQSTVCGFTLSELIIQCVGALYVNVVLKAARSLVGMKIVCNLRFNICREITPVPCPASYPHNAVWETVVLISYTPRKLLHVRDSSQMVFTSYLFADTT